MAQWCRIKEWFFPSFFNPEGFAYWGKKGDLLSETLPWLDTQEQSSIEILEQTQKWAPWDLVAVAAGSVLRLPKLMSQLINNAAQGHRSGDMRATYLPPSLNIFPWKITQMGPHNRVRLEDRSSSVYWLLLCEFHFDSQQACCGFSGTGFVVRYHELVSRCGNRRHSDSK